MLELVRCHGRTDCRSDAEIDAILQSSKLVLLKNEVRFDQQRNGREAIIEESTVEMIQIDPFNKSMFPYQVSITELSLQDMALDLDDLTLYENKNVFKVE